MVNVHTGVYGEAPRDSITGMLRANGIGCTNSDAKAICELLTDPRHRLLVLTGYADHGRNQCRKFALHPRCPVPTWLTASGVVPIAYTLEEHQAALRADAEVVNDFCIVVPQIPVSAFGNAGSGKSGAKAKCVKAMRPTAKGQMGSPLPSPEKSIGFTRYCPTRINQGVEADNGWPQWAEDGLGRESRRTGTVSRGSTAYLPSEH
jgi:hypothetical protein